MPAGFSQPLDRVPDLLALAAAAPEDFPFLLDDASGSGRSLLLFAGSACLARHTDGRVEGPGRGTGFFARLQDWYLAERRRPEPGKGDGRWGFSGGWFLYLGYEMAGEVEPVLQLPQSRANIPDAFAWRCHGALVVDESDLAAGPRAYASAESPAALEALLDRLDSIPSDSTPSIPALPDLAALEAGDPDRFCADTRRVLDYLAAGDVFQVNISRRWAGRFSGQPDPVSLYRRLRASNPAPFAGLARWRGATVLCSSPERLVEVRGDRVQTRPIAGTRPRGANPEQDMALSRELIGNLKERAEHVMLIDLERNDLGRVCRPGTVEVNELMTIESYAHVHHIVSNIRGRLRADATPVQAIQAVFPGGTITGCPKVRCMEIIAELEGEGRGFYTGSMGYLGLDGSLDLNILIRTMLVDAETFTFRTGAGIVADSEPTRELQETEDKARGLLLALQTDAARQARA